LIIGEKINGTRKQAGKANTARDKKIIQDLALRQVEAGINWLVDVIHEVTNIPLSLWQSRLDRMHLFWTRSNRINGILIIFGVSNI
jgi:hypothetical protein